MNRTVKVAISLPADLLDAVERRRLDRGTSRSEFFREALIARLSSDDATDSERYIAAYRANPETEEELAEADVALAELASEPWQ